MWNSPQFLFCCSYSDFSGCTYLTVALIWTDETFHTVNEKAWIKENSKNKHGKAFNGTKANKVLYLYFILEFKLEYSISPSVICTIQ